MGGEEITRQRFGYDIDGGRVAGGLVLMPPSPPRDAFLQKQAHLSEQALRKTLSRLETNDVFNLNDLQQLRALPVWSSVLPPLTASKISRALTSHEQKTIEAPPTVDIKPPSASPLPIDEVKPRPGELDSLTLPRIRHRSGNSGLLGRLRQAAGVPETSKAEAATSTCGLSLIFSQHKHGHCTPSKSFGCVDESHIWVNGGCRGIFNCSGAVFRCGYHHTSGVEKCLCEDHSGPPGACGVYSDCPPGRNTSSIKASASMWDPSNPDFTTALHERHVAARAACDTQQLHTTVLSTGAWCLSSPKTGRAGRRSGGTVSLGNETHVLPQGHYPADAIVASVLGALLQNAIPSLATDRPQSVNDFGAGVGQYGHALRAMYPGINWRGYDGAGNVEQYTNGYVRFFDLTLPLSLPKADWVLSLEVGEHLPHDFEFMYLRNLHAHQHRGVIGSWAGLGQLGTGHVNNHRRDYVVSRFVELGYKPHLELEHLLRHGNVTFRRLKNLPTYSQIRRNIFAFVRVAV